MLRRNSQRQAAVHHINCSSISFDWPEARSLSDDDSPKNYGSYGNHAETCFR